MSAASGLPEPRTPEGRSGLAAILADPGGSVIAFDFDGTLAPIVADPDAARAHPDAVRALRRLAPCVDSVVVVTGRPAATAAEYADLGGLPGNVTVLGHYGWERWQAGSVRAPDPAAGLALVRAELPDLLAGEPGAWIEDKHLAVAVHTRRAEDPSGAFDRLRGPLGDLADRAGLAVEPGRLVVELRPPGMDKGAALEAFAGEREARAVLFGGDDLGDLPGFDAVDTLRRRGVVAVTVCSSSDEVTALAERADIVVDGPEGVAALLDALATALGAPALG